jgi:hypothetical protein
MGGKQNQPFQLSFNASLKIDFQGSRVTSDGGFILVRELDERLGFGELIAQRLTDSRRGKNTQLPLADLLRQSVYSRAAGYKDVNDAERLSQDPTFRPIGSEKIWERGAALTFRLQAICAGNLAADLVPGHNWCRYRCAPSASSRSSPRFRSGRRPGPTRPSRPLLRTLNCAAKPSA